MLTAPPLPAPPAAGSGDDRRRPPRRRRLIRAALGAVVVAAAVALLTTTGTRHTTGRPPGGPVAQWFAGSTTAGCLATTRGDLPPGAIGAITCPLPDSTVVYSQFPTAAAARQYLDGQELAHQGATLSEWKSGGSAATGRALFYADKGRSTLLWTYDGQPYVGWASTSGSATALEAWWTTSGRVTRGS